MSDLNGLIAKLKSGEYDGSDIMSAWIALEELESTKSDLVKIKAEAFREVGEILKYQYEGFYDQSSIEDFFDERANKLERGEL